MSKFLRNCIFRSTNLTVFLSNTHEFARFLATAVVYPANGKKLADPKAKELKEIKTRGRKRKDAFILYNCGWCFKSFDSPSVLLRHQGAHLGSKRFRCQYCFKSFGQKSNLDRHQILHSFKGFPYQCLGKGEKTIRKGSHQCSYCSKSFLSSSHIEIHERIHTGKSPYHCRYCYRVFQDNTECKKHERLHLGLKLYQCCYCGKRFYENGHTRQHEATHTKKKTYIMRRRKPKGHQMI